MSYASAQHGEILFDIDVPAWVSSSGADNAKTHVSAPFEVTCYSRDETRRVMYGSRAQLCTFSQPQLKVNLGEKYDTFIRKADEQAPVEPILKALVAKSFDLESQADIVTYRNNLNKIGATPYENRDDWELDCALVGRTVYLDIRKVRDDSSDPQQQLFQYYGYRFEALCTGMNEEPVNANSEFCSISRIRIANHRIVLASEIDCASGRVASGGNPLHGYIELKTMKAVDTDRALNNMYQHRFLKYWLQSYLAGVPTIMLGIRSGSGELLHVKHLRTHDLPREARHHFQRTRARNRWDPFVCVNFLDCVLASIRQACHDRPGSTIRVRFDAATKHITATLVTGPGEGLSPRIMRAHEESRSV